MLEIGSKDSEPAVLDKIIYKTRSNCCGQEDILEINNKA